MKYQLPALVCRFIQGIPVLYVGTLHLSKKARDLNDLALLIQKAQVLCKVVAESYICDVALFDRWDISTTSSLKTGSW
jgi:hypothetical protein